MEQKTDIPKEFEAEYDSGTLTVEGNETEVSRKMEHALIDVEVEDGNVIFSSHQENKQVKSIIGTFKSHLENMIEGLEEEHVYKMQGVYAHFPMDIKVQGDELLIENFMGERNPRRVEIEDGVNVDVDGEELEIKGANKEAVGLTAGRIEQACKKGNRDPRTFQDGIYITDKGDGQ